MAADQEEKSESNGETVAESRPVVQGRPGLPGARPNVLFIMVDQWPGHLLGCAGHPVIETPTLDRLASLGTRYGRAYSESPICIAARRTLMTGTSPRTHGDRVFNARLPMPAGMPTLASAFRGAGYQAMAIGKLHVYPFRDRIGFDDALLLSEGREGTGDYDLFLADKGHVGQHVLHGMGHNEYTWRTWHLPEELHPTSWVTLTAARQIRRRDPTRPGFWYVSYPAPHPPLVPLASYLERYRGRQIDEPLMGDWANAADVPYTVRMARLLRDRLTAEQIADVRRAFYAQCTHIDHQIRLLIGTLNDEEILDNTIILFCADHGDMLGDHGLFAKRLMYEGSAHIPLILLDTEQGKRVAVGHVDMRLAGLQDVMPTLLELCGIPVPATCEGLSLVGNKARSTLYAEWGVGSTSTRMIHNGRYKMIWYPAGNRFQLFDLEADPHELSDISGQEAHVKLLGRLRSVLARNFYGTDTKHFRDNKIYGLADPKRKFRASRDLSRQRGLAFPARSGGGEDEE